MRLLPQVMDPRLDRRLLLAALRAFRAGDFGASLKGAFRGTDREIAETFNDVVELARSLQDELSALRLSFGQEGRSARRMREIGAHGAWAECAGSVNDMLEAVTGHTAELSRLLTALAQGDFDASIELERAEGAPRGDFLRDARAANLAATRLRALRAELLRLAAAIPAEGKLSLRANTASAPGAFRELLDAANLLAAAVGGSAPAARRDGAPAGQDEPAQLRSGIVRPEFSEQLGELVALFASAREPRPSEPRAQPKAQDVRVQPVRAEAAILQRELAAQLDAHDRAIAGLERFTPSPPLTAPAAGRSAVSNGSSNANGNGRPTAQVRPAAPPVAQLTAPTPPPVAPPTVPSSPRAGDEGFERERAELSHERRELELESERLAQQRLELERARKDAEQLALTSKHKSQFLAHMSHELRTPLNTLLMLSRQLVQGSDASSGGKQVRYAETIEQAGGDLLDLINEFLDLAKIESGTMGVEMAPVALLRLKAYLEQTFKPLADEKRLTFEATIDPSLPARIETDERRLRQILRNLLTNALKFTEQGSVRLSIERAGDAIEFAVSDTGIGIPEAEQTLIFESFRQAGAAQRGNYPGTGLGLAISRDVARLLGGQLRVQTAPGTGSTFRLQQPLRAAALERTPRARPNGRRVAAPLRVVGGSAVEPVAAPVAPRNSGESLLLVVGEQAGAADGLSAAGHELGFRCVHSANAELAYAAVRAQRPDAIVLGLDLPDGDGRVLLDRLKHDALLRHIPVYATSLKDRERESLERGAVGFLRQPAAPEALQRALRELRECFERTERRVLLAVGDARERRELSELLSFDEVSCEAVESAEQALELMTRVRFDCIVFDLGLPGVWRLDLLERMRGEERLRRLPILAYVRERGEQQDIRLAALAETLLVKVVASPAQLLSEAARFLHLPEARLPEKKRALVRSCAVADPELEHRKVLVVDDDIRSIFALTAMLEPHKVRVGYAANGVRALAKLASESDTELVLIDVRMPDLDGYEVMRRICSQARGRRSKMIAMTGNVSPGEREKCLAAGADDYIVKPIDPDQLLSMLRVWLSERTSPGPS